MTDKPIESIIIPEEQAECWDEVSESFVLNAPSNFYVLLAIGSRCYYKTKDRLAAQKQADEDWGVGKYKIRVVRDLKGKSKQENGGQSVYATATRAKGSSKPPR
jgi:hypothetical protein